MSLTTKGRFLCELFTEAFDRFWDKYKDEEVARGCALSVVGSVPAFAPDHRFWKNGIYDFLNDNWVRFSNLVHAQLEVAKGNISPQEADRRLQEELRVMERWFDQKYPETAPKPDLAPIPALISGPVPPPNDKGEVLLFTGSCSVCGVEHASSKEEHNKPCNNELKNPDGVVTRCPGRVELIIRRNVKVVVLGKPGEVNVQEIKKELAKELKTSGTTTGRLLTPSPSSGTDPTLKSALNEAVKYHDGIKHTEFKGVCTNCEKVHYDSEEGFVDCDSTKEKCLGTVWLSKNVEESDAA